MRGIMRLCGLLLACAATFGVGLTAPATAQGSYSPYNETATAALARYVRALASDPKDFDALIGAGKSALEIGDTQAAAGFFARADDVNPRSPLPQAGMGAVSVAAGDPQGAIPYFARAVQLGAKVSAIACDRGLAFDLLGRQADAQSDYRVALAGADADEARRRLALSLAISGDRDGALQAIAPLAAKGEVSTGRVRAFVLALTGDSTGAMTAADRAMPGSFASVAPFLQKLPSLSAGQKAAAVNLGIFPDGGSGTAYAYKNVPQPTPIVTGSVTTNRLAGIDDLLRERAQPAAPAQILRQPAPPVAPRIQQVAYNAPVNRVQVQQATAPAPRKIWLQLASGSNETALSDQFARIKSRDRELFDGIRGYVAKSSDRSRLLIGPFRSATDADTFAADLETVDVNAFKWSNSPSDQIVPLGTP
jgi:Flp pilus assembly protein TadD